MLLLTWLSNPYFVLMMGTALLALTILIYSLRHWSLSIAPPFAALCFTLLCWLVGVALMIQMEDLSSVLNAVKLQQIGYTGVSPAWFIFACRFSGREVWLKPSRLAVIIGLPLLMLALFWSNELHGLMFTQPAVEQTAAGSNLTLRFEALFWVHTAIAYVLIVTGSGFILNYTLTSDRFRRSQMVGLIAAGIVPLASNILSLAGLNPLPIDLTPLAFIVSLGALAISVFRLNLFDLLPLTYEKLLSTLQDGVIVLDEQTRIVQINDAALRQFNLPDSKAVMGKPALVAFAPWEQYVRPVLAHDQLETEVKVETDTGETRWFIVRVSPLVEEVAGRSRLRGRVVVLIEVTARKRNELALAQARDHALQLDQFKTQLLSNISHDFRTPLGSIKGYAELLYGGYLDSSPTKRAEAMLSIIDNAGYLDRLVNQLLDKASLTTGRIVLHPTIFSPEKLAQTIAETASILAENKGLTFAVSVTPALPVQLRGDVQRIQQIVMNLTSNAIKFTQQGSITLSLDCADDQRWAICVRDTGPGIPPDLVEIIFEPFRQLPGTLQPKGQERGFGLGLSIVRDLVHLMGGTIDVTSQVGTVSTFTVNLPLHVVDEVLDDTLPLRPDH